MTPEMMKYFIMGVFGLFAIVAIIYYILMKKMQNKTTKYVASLVQGTKKSSFSMEIFYQKFYINCAKIPFLRRYTLKLRRRLEIINLEDEYLTRKQVAQIMLKAILIVIPLTVIVIMATKSNFLIMSSLLLFEIFFIESINSASLYISFFLKLISIPFASALLAGM